MNADFLRFIWFPLRESSGGSRISQRGVRQPQGAPTYYVTNFSWKRHENEKIWPGGARDAPHSLDPPLEKAMKSGMWKM